MLQVAVYEVGQDLMVEGCPAESFFMVEEGSLELTRRRYQVMSVQCVGRVLYSPPTSRSTQRVRVRAVVHACMCVLCACMCCVLCVVFCVCCVVLGQHHLFYPLECSFVRVNPSLRALVALIRRPFAVAQELNRGEEPPKGGFGTCAAPSPAAKAGFQSDKSDRDTVILLGILISSTY
jgi:hypothetical protein